MGARRTQSSWRKNDFLCLTQDLCHSLGLDLTVDIISASGAELRVLTLFVAAHSPHQRAAAWRPASRRRCLQRSCAGAQCGRPPPGSTPSAEAVPGMACKGHQKSNQFSQNQWTLGIQNIKIIRPSKLLKIVLILNILYIFVIFISPDNFQFFSLLRAG